MRPWGKIVLFIIGSAAVVLIVAQQNTIRRLRAGNEQCREEARAPEAARLSSPITADPPAPDEKEHLELLRLRNEVSRLRAATNELITQAQDSLGFYQTVRQKERTLTAENRKLKAALQAIADEKRPSSPPRVGAWLGINMQEASTLAALTGLTNGVVVASLSQGSPAQRAKLREGDLIVRVDGQDIVGSSDFKALLTQKPVGQPMILEIMREKSLIKLEVIPRGWPN